MNDPKPPSEGSVHSLATVPAASARLDLTWDEMAVLASFRAMDDRRKREAPIRMERIACTHPGRAGPRLRLISTPSL
jgi:hypothetical protein